MKTVFTTGEAAKICKVSQQTIIRCFDSGQLKGFRVPGSRFRRIPRDVLYKFMKDNGIPTDALESGKRKALVVDDDRELLELIRDALEAEQGDARFDGDGVGCAVDREPERNGFGSQDRGIGDARCRRHESGGRGPDTHRLEKGPPGDAEGCRVTRR